GGRARVDADELRGDGLGVPDRVEGAEADLGRLGDRDRADVVLAGEQGRIGAVRRVPDLRDARAGGVARGEADRDRARRPPAGTGAAVAGDRGGRRLPVGRDGEGRGRGGQAGAVRRGHV